MGNIHSILKALRLYIPDTRYSKDPKEISHASALVLPGDGAFQAAMQGLSGELRESITEFAQKGRPLLGICIGFQVLFKDSDESHASSENCTQGLGLIPGRIRRFSFTDETRVPHMGWNRLLYTNKREALRKTYMYFIHSYRAVEVPENRVVAYCNYSGDIFPAWIKQANITATQFHPEKSGEDGLAILSSWCASLA